MPIETLNLHVTNRCNSHCLHCMFWRRQAEMKEPDFGPWHRLIHDAARISPGAVVQFTGGEPLLCNELFPLIRAAKQYNFKKTVVTTNGLAWSVEQIKELCATELDELVISLDGFSETHDRLRGVKGAFHRAFGLIDSIYNQTHHPIIHILTVISGVNLGELREFFIFLEREARISSVVFQVITQPMPDTIDSKWHIGNELWPHDNQLLDRTFDWLTDAKLSGRRIRNSAEQLRTMRRYFNNPDRMIWDQCNIGVRYLVVTPDGGVKNCPMMEDIGDIYQGDIESILNSEGAARRLIDMRRCDRNCHFLVNCGFRSDQG